LTTQPENRPPTEAPRRKPDAAKLLLAAALIFVAGYLVATRYTDAAVDWHLGDIRRDPADPAPKAALARLGDRAVARIERELRSQDPDPRVVAVIALAAIRSPGSDRLLAEAARDDDGMTAANAVAACAARADAATAAAVIEALGDARYQVRLAARRAASVRTGGVPWWAFGAAAEAAKKAAGEGG
jgi:hypothetical protein